MTWRTLGCTSRCEVKPERNAAPGARSTLLLNQAAQIGSLVLACGRSPDLSLRSIDPFLMVACQFKEMNRFRHTLPLDVTNPLPTRESSAKVFDAPQAVGEP